MTPPIPTTSNPLNKSRITLPAALLLAAVWNIAGCKSKPPAPPPTSQTQPQAPAPIAKKHIYSETADPTLDIAAALKQARIEHKRVLLDFGGDWCGDCQVLDIYFHQSPNSDLLDNNFVLVHIFIGHMDKHVDVAQKYGVPLNKGVPALAVLDAHGKVLFSQTSGEFEDMRHMNSQSVTEFLDRWKA